MTTAQKNELLLRLEAEHEESMHHYDGLINEEVRKFLRRLDHFNGGGYSEESRLRHIADAIVGSAKRIAADNERRDDLNVRRYCVKSFLSALPTDD